MTIQSSFSSRLAVQTNTDGHKIVELARLSGGLGAYLVDTSRQEIDCSAARWRTLSDATRGYFDQRIMESLEQEAAEQR